MPFFLASFSASSFGQRPPKLNSFNPLFLAYFIASQSIKRVAEAISVFSFLSFASSRFEAQIQASIAFWFSRYRLADSILPSNSAKKRVPYFFMLSSGMFPTPNVLNKGFMPFFWMKDLYIWRNCW